MEDLDLPMLKRMEKSSEKRQVQVERELVSTATLTRVAKPSLSSTVLELMVSVSLRVPIFPMEPMVRTLLLMTPTIESQPQSNNNNSHSNHSSITTNSPQPPTWLCPACPACCKTCPAATAVQLQLQQ